MNYAVIVAGGIGSRMASSTPKQFLLLEGLPVMMHAMNAFLQSRYSPLLVIALHPDLHQAWSELCDTHRFSIPHRVLDGGKSRFETVKKSIAFIKSVEPVLSQSLIAIHDAARPLITTTLIDQSYDAAMQYGAAALAIPSTNAVRIKSSNGLKNNAYDRSRIFLMQTPQTFNGHILTNAYEQPEEDHFTDDASVVEKKGYPVTIVDGDTRNLKITFPEDIQLAAVLLHASH